MWGILLFAAMTLADVEKLLEQGRNLSANPLQRLEQRLKANPDDAAARIQLLAWYTENASTAGEATAKVARVDHILWFLKYDAKNPVLTHSSGVGKLNCETKPTSRDEEQACELQERQRK
jgi:hypothetical protein